MIQHEKVFSSCSSNNIEAAKKFYKEVLGIEVAEGIEGTILLMLGSSRHLIYPKPNHEPATFTVLNFPVADLEKTVDELTAKGVKFEHYDLGDGSTDEKGIFRGGGPLIAWFKDPAGNILSVIQEN